MKPNFLKDTMLIFSVDVLVLIFLTWVFGEDAKEISTLFRLGSRGIALETLLQFFLSSVVISALRQIFFTEKIFKNMMALWRSIGMLLSVIVFISGFIAFFGWFPVDSKEGWLGFIVSFLICFLASTGVMVLKTRSQSRKYEKLLEEYQNQNGKRDKDAE